jgi:hypothetical protein
VISGGGPVDNGGGIRGVRGLLGPACPGAVRSSTARPHVRHRAYAGTTPTSSTSPPPLLLLVF